MGKKSIKKTDLYSAVKRQRLYILYYDMFFNLWMGKYRVEGMNYRANYFLFKSFWDNNQAKIIEIMKTRHNIFLSHCVDGYYLYKKPLNFNK